MDNRLTSVFRSPSGWLLICLMIMGGCATASPPVTAHLPASPPSNGLLQEAKAEADRLRGALAAERIALAKQRAQVRLSQEALTTARERETDMLNNMTKVQGEIATLKADRDRLRKENAELRGKTTAMPQFLQLMTEIRSLQTSFNTLSDSLETFKADFVKFREEWQARRSPRTVRTRRRTAGTPSRVSLGEGERYQLTIQPGDSLWRIAEMYGVTVEDIQEWNHLEGDLIFPGQQLSLPLHVVHSSQSEGASSKATVSSTVPSDESTTIEKP